MRSMTDEGEVLTVAVHPHPTRFAGHLLPGEKEKLKTEI
jgi:hypothetical protein